MQYRTKNTYLISMGTLHKNILTFIVFIALAALLGKNVSAQKTESGINEFWHELYVYRNFNEKWSGKILFNNLYSSKFGNYDWFLEGKVSYQANHWLDIEALYRHEFYDFNGEKVQEYRPMIRFSGKTKIGNWNFHNRHRFELRMFEIGKKQFRYRTDLKIKPNFNWTSLNLNPYLQEEIFIAEKNISRNRIYLGIEGKKGRFEPAVYTLMQSVNFDSVWNSRFIIGVLLGIELNTLSQ